GHRGGTVHVPADPVADGLADHREALGLDVGLDRVADVADVVARARLLDTPAERLAGHLEEAPALLGGGAAGDAQPAVRPPAVEDEAAVEGDEVALLDHPAARHAVDHLLRSEE